MKWFILIGCWLGLLLLFLMVEPWINRLIKRDAEEFDKKDGEN